MNTQLRHSLWFLVAGWMILLAGSAHANLGLSIEANPDPAEPGEVLNIQLTVTNPDGFDRSGVELRMVYPVGLQDLFHLAISDGGSCAPTVSNNGHCDATELLVWNLGTIAAGTGVTVSLPPIVDPALTPGSTILFEPEVEDSTATITSASRSVDIINDRALELLLTEVSQEPVTGGGQLVYQLSYGHTATSVAAPNATLDLPIPAGLSFVSADGGGTNVGGTVQWALGTLVPGQSGERRVIFDVDVGVSAGTAIEAEAVLQDTGGQLSRANAVTRVEDPVPLQLVIEANANPAEPGEVLGVELTVANSSFFDRANVVLRMRYPVGLQSLLHSAITDGGTCVASVANNGRCDATELLVWNLGTLAAGTGVTVTLPPSVAASTVPGSLLGFTAEVTDSTGRIVAASEVVGVINDRALELLLTEVSQEPVTAGGQLVYQLSFGHTATSVVALNATLELPVPAGLVFVSADGGGMLSGDTVQWALGTLVPGQSGERRVVFDVDVGVSAGTAIKAEAVLQDTDGQLNRADAVTRVEDPVPLQLVIEANANPAEPGEVLGVELTVANSSFFDRANVVLRMRYPVGLQSLLHSAITDGGTCVASVANNGRCDATELLVWNLGTLAAGTGVTVNLPPGVDISAVPGSLLGFTAEVTDSFGRIVAASEVVEVINDRALELLLTEVSQEPVTAGSQLIYQLSYGHTATSAVAPGATLELPVPAGLVFVSADGGGMLSGDTVQWALGTLVPGQSGERRVIFDVDVGVSAGTAIKAEAVLQDTGGQLSRADEVTRVEDPAPLQLAIEANANPAEPGEVLGVELTVTNSSSFDRANVVLQMRYPVGLQSLLHSAITDGGTCVASVANNGRCDATELLVWNLGTLAAGTGVTVNLPPGVDISAVPGSLIEFNAVVADSSGSTTQANETLSVVNDRTLELVLSEAALDPAVPGDNLTYVLNWGYSASSAVAAGTTLELEVPKGLIFVSADGGGTLSGDTVQWALGTLDPGTVGERRATFNIGAGVADGTLTRAEAVMQDSSGLRVRADAVTRFESAAPLNVAVDVTVNPALPGTTLSAELTVTNSSLFDRADVVLRMRYPVGLQNLLHSEISDGGTCVPSVSNNSRCDATETLVWNLGTILAGATVTVSLPPVINAVPDISKGQQIEFVAWVEDSADRSRAIDVVGVGPPPDTDLDGEPDDIDNCIEVPNGTLIPDPGGNIQLDTDSDGYGNMCDGDLNNTGTTNTLDLNLYKLAHRSSLGDANYNVDADFNGDDRINTLDLNIYKTLHRKPPGPSCCGLF